MPNKRYVDSQSVRSRIHVKLCLIWHFHFYNPVQTSLASLTPPFFISTFIDLTPHHLAIIPIRVLCIPHI